MALAPVIALSHGGGPMPLLGDPLHNNITSSLQTRVPQILGLGTPSSPRAILLITAHWSESRPTISSAAKHPLYYDYGGFPKEAYAVKYPAPGSPEVAEEVRAAFAEAGLEPVMDSRRGWDHGVFVPMKLVNPAADVPIVQVSVVESEDPEVHLLMGQALARLRQKGVAIVGSGFASWHNQRAMVSLMHRPSGDKESPLITASRTWNNALTNATTAKAKEERWDKLKRWRGMPHAYDMHPAGGAEHFMPLLVCAGAAGEGEEGDSYRDGFLGLDIYTYYWGGAKKVD